MHPFATVEDIERVWRELTPAEELMAEGLIAEASLKLRVAIPNIDALVDANHVLRSELAKAAVVNAVKRVLMNPEALRQYSVTTGPFSESKTIDNALSSGFIYIDKGDLVGLIFKKSAIRSFRVRAGLG
jgi:hypothetical protein